jgi:hypothetical protein
MESLVERNAIMMIYGYIPKSKPKKLTKAQLEQKAEWLKALNKISGKRIISTSTNFNKTIPSPKIPAGRETPKFASLDTGFIPCTKSVQGNTYTGEKMKGVATMHKSNAVPVFTDSEAKEISSMRR